MFPIFANNFLFTDKGLEDGNLQAHNVVCKCRPGNMNIPVIGLDPVSIGGHFMSEVKARNS